MFLAMRFAEASSIPAAVRDWARIPLEKRVECSSDSTRIVSPDKLPFSTAENYRD
jgi:hypothetical protein